MGPKRIKHATRDAPTINVHNESKYGCPFPLVENGENTDVNDREDPPECSNIDRNGQKCLVNLIESNCLRGLVDPNDFLASSQQLDHEDPHICGQSHEVYHSHDVKKNGKAPLKEYPMRYHKKRIR